MYIKYLFLHSNKVIELIDDQDDEQANRRDEEAAWEIARSSHAIGRTLDLGAQCPVLEVGIVTKFYGRDDFPGTGIEPDLVFITAKYLSGDLGAFPLVDLDRTAEHELTLLADDMIEDDGTNLLVTDIRNHQILKLPDVLCIIPKSYYSVNAYDPQYPEKHVFRYVNDKARMWVREQFEIFVTSANVSTTDEIQSDVDVLNFEPERQQLISALNIHCELCSLNDLNGEGDLYQCDLCDGYFHAACCGIDIDAELDSELELNLESLEFICIDCKQIGEIEKKRAIERKRKRREHWEVHPSNAKKRIVRPNRRFFDDQL